jgi:hypothetical protein
MACHWIGSSFQNIEALNQGPMQAVDAKDTGSDLISRLTDAMDCSTALLQA